MEPMLIDGAGPYVSLVVTAVIVMGTPGPATVAAVATATAFGLRRSLPYLVGSIVGTGVVLAAVVAGLTSVVLASPQLRPVLLVLSVGYLAYLAYKIATAPPLAVDDRNTRPPAWVSGFVVGVGNPKAYAALGTVFAGSTIELSSPLLETLVKTAILVILIVLIHVGWAVAGASFSGAFRRPRISRVVNVVLAMALLGSAVLFVGEL